MKQEVTKTNTKGKEYSVLGSKGDTYLVTRPRVLTENWTCTCPHHFHRQAECKHIKEVKTKLGIV